MSLHADVSVPGNDRRRLERLCRYVARPSLSLDRLEAMADGRLAYRLKTRWRDGTIHVVIERDELLERLAPHSEVVASSPPLRAHQVRYHGVLAPCASGRSRVVPIVNGQEASFVAARDTRNLSLTAEVESPVRKRTIELSMPAFSVMKHSGDFDGAAQDVEARHLLFVVGRDLIE